MYPLLVLVGLMGFELGRRLAATARPRGGAHPWYGRNAAAAIVRAPSLSQIAVALGAVAMLLASRHPHATPIALGLSLGAARELLLWKLLPLVIRVRDDTKPSLGGRLLPLEQLKVQAELRGMWATWWKLPSLAEGQTPTPTIRPPMAPTSLKVVGSSDK